MSNFPQNGYALRRYFFLGALLLVTTNLGAQTQQLNFNLSNYEDQKGLRATVKDDVLTVRWKGDRNSHLRLRFGVDNGVPTIHELAMRNVKNDWQVLASNLVPEFRVVAGLRRVTRQQTKPLEALAIPLTEKKLNEIKWNAFWDAPLYLEDEPPPTHQNSIPATQAFANHPGMPREQDEVVRATASFRTTRCEVRTNGARLEIRFLGVEAGIFKGYLQFDIFKGSNLIRQMLVAKTDRLSTAFKYDAGLKGLSLEPSSKVVWRDLENVYQENDLSRSINHNLEIVKGNNRLIAAEMQGGSIAMFPPPHRFYWSRETEQNLGYGWCRKDSDRTFSLGIRQAEMEEDPEFYHNFALYNARPDNWQYMPVFLYVRARSGASAIDAALAFTHGDRFKPLPGYKVMGSHYHVGLVKRLEELGGLDQKLNDVETIKGVGIDIYGVVDGARGLGRHDKGDLYLNDLAEYYEAAKSQSDENFLVMPNDENSTGGRPPFLGGHYDIIPSKPIYWRPQRKPDQPLAEEHPKYGTVYNLGDPMDMMDMAERENFLISMPHPDAKGSTGFPEAIKNEPQFLHPNYFALGYRWGMGIDASEIRLGESRFLPLWDEANNWMAEKGFSPKFALAISEARSDYGDRGKPAVDDVYGMSPVNYLKLDKVPSLEDMSSIVDALKKGEYFVTTGEVLIPSYEIKGTGNTRTIVAEVEWTFPLDFVEVVWGDGEKTDRQIIPTTDLLPFGTNRFEIPFDAKGKKWVRFAAWDVAANGAMVQPTDLTKTMD